MAPPDRLGKYTLRGTLGRGAMGTVYDGWDPAIDRRVAIKTVKLADAEDEETQEALARFKREAQAAGRLSHPNIVGVYDYGETEELAYIVMEFVEGRSLKSLLDQERRLPPAEAGTIMQQVLAGLAYSHARGVVHRDIKPANMMLTTEGQVKIADFGIARIESSSMTSVGTVMGTPAYMPPEQFLGEAVDARSDIYAAGVMLFHLLTGERPYEGSMTAIMQKVLNPEPPPAASARASIPTVFDGVIAGAMAKAPAERYPTAAAFAQALRAALESAANEPDSDATMVAPSRGRPTAAADPLDDVFGPGGTLGATRPPAQPAVERVVAAAATMPAAKKGPPLGLIGGGVAALLVAAGGAWFALQPGTPKPPPPVAPTLTPAAPAVTQTPEKVRPASPPPATSIPAAPPAMGAAKPAKPSLEQAQAAVLAVLPNAACSALSVAAAGGSLTIGGLVGESRLADARKAVDEAAAGTSIAWSAATVPDTYCAGLVALNAASAPQDGVTQPPLGMTISGKSGQVRLVSKQAVAPRVTMPGFAATLTVDYFSNDGSMFHMLPKATAPLLKPGTLRVLQRNAGEIGDVGSPFGRDLVIAIASSEPLLKRPRPADETLDQYASALADAIRAARAHGASTVASAMVVDTAEK